MKIKMNSAMLSSEEVREMGFSLVNLATLMKRAETQVAQAKEIPNHKELAEARAATNRVKDAIATHNCLIAATRK